MCIRDSHKPGQPQHVVYFYTASHPVFGDWLKQDIARYDLRLQPDYRAWDRPVGGSDNASFASVSYTHLNIFAYRLFPFLVYKLLALEMHHPYTKESSQTDKYRIDEIKIERSQEVYQIARRQSISSRTKWRHQSGGNGNTGNYVSFLFCRECHHTGQTTHQCDEYVVNRR